MDKKFCPRSLKRPCQLTMVPSKLSFLWNSLMCSRNCIRLHSILVLHNWQWKVWTSCNSFFWCVFTLTETSWNSLKSIFWCVFSMSKLFEQLGETNDPTTSVPNGQFETLEWGLEFENSTERYGVQTNTDEMMLRKWTFNSLGWICNMIDVRLKSRGGQQRHKRLCFDKEICYAFQASTFSIKKRSYLLLFHEFFTCFLIFHIFSWNRNG